MTHITGYRQAGAVFSLLLVACSPADTHDKTMEGGNWPFERTTVSYTCTEPETLVVRHYQDRAGLWIDGAWLVLPQLISASGVRYSDGETVFWEKGKEARFERPGLSDQMCTLAEVPGQWADAAGRGVVVRAIGQEPGWILEIHETGRTGFSYAYGTEQVDFDQTAPTSRSDALIYKASAKGHRLVARVTPGPCLDSMSGEFMTHHVKVKLDDTTYQGCGRILKRQ